MPRPTATSTVLVTGASGFVGACAVRALAERPLQLEGGTPLRVVAVHSRARARSTSWRMVGAPASIQHVHADLTARGDVDALVDEVRPAVIINAAAYGAYAVQRQAERIYAVNFDAVRHLVDAARTLDGFAAFIQTGSSSEYGTKCSAPLESEAPAPDSDYAVSKVAASAYLQFVGQKHGFPGWTLRLSSVFGPFEDMSRLVPQLLERALQGGFPPLVNPRISRDFIYVDDVIDAMRRVVAHAGTIPRGEVFNLGTGVCTTLGDIVARVRALFGIAEEPRWGTMAERHWDHADWFSNPGKAATILGFRAAVSLDDGLTRTAEWMRANPDRVDAGRLQAVTGAR